MRWLIYLVIITLFLPVAFGSFCSMQVMGNLTTQDNHPATADIEIKKDAITYYTGEYNGSYGVDKTMYLPGDTKINSSFDVYVNGDLATTREFVCDEVAVIDFVLNYNETGGKSPKELIQKARDDASNFNIKEMDFLDWIMLAAIAFLVYKLFFDTKRKEKARYY